MSLNKLQPGLREIIDGSVTLTAEERHALETEGMLVCMPVADNDAAEELWQDRGLPASFEGDCDMCGTPIHFRPWAAIAAKKICVACYIALDRAASA